MAEAEDSLRQVCQLDDIVSGKEWKEIPLAHHDLTKVIITMGRERREVASVITDNEIKELIHDNSKPNDLVILTALSRQGNRVDGAMSLTPTIK